MVTHDIESLRATTDRIAVLVRHKLTVLQLKAWCATLTPGSNYFAGARDVPRSLAEVRTSLGKQ